MTLAPLAMSLAAFGVALCLPLAAHAEIFKCVGKDGRTTFQDSRCIGTVGTTVTVRPAGNGGDGVYFAPPKLLSSTPTELPGSPKPEPSPGPSTSKPNTQAERDAAALKGFETDRKRRSIDYEIRDTESALESLKASMEQEVSGIRVRKETLTNSVPGTPLEQGAAAELQAATDRHGSQIRVVDERLTELRKQRDDIGKVK